MKKIGKYAIFNYENKNEGLVDELENYLNKNADEIFKFFKVENPKELPIINIIDNKNEFDNLFLSTWNYQPESWSIGFYNNNQITYLSLKGCKNTSHKIKNMEDNLALDYYKKTIVHEYVHYINDLFKIKNKCGYTEKYLSEGLAVYLSKQNENSKINFDYALEQILSPNSNCYSGWYLVVKYLIENYDKELVLNLIKSNRQAREFLQQELFEKVENFYSENSNQL